MKVRSMVGLLPLMATVVLPGEVFEKLPTFKKRVDRFIARHPELCSNLHLANEQGVMGRRLISIVDARKLRLILSRMLDENEFLSPHGIRSMSKHHLKHPYKFHWGGHTFKVQYVPGESDSGLFGGNSNWRGPVWIPMNFLIIRELIELYCYFGDDFKIEHPTGSGKFMDLYDVALELANRLISLFEPDSSGHRPVNNHQERWQDPHWKDLLFYHEYFHGETGKGLGSIHQTGWTGLVARLIQLVRTWTKKYC